MSSDGPKWIYPSVDPTWHESIAKEFSIHPTIAQVIAARKFKTFEEIHAFLYAKLPNLIDPNLFPDMDKAVARVRRALREKENILIYGDNDVDGITAAALLTEFFQSLGANVSYYIPNRNSLRGTIISRAIEQALKFKASLIITVDCSISETDELIEAAKNNIDVIITDHHEPTAKNPHCVATLNPKLKNTTYPDRDLTGVGVAFKLAHAITNDLINAGELSSSEIDLKRYLDLVALGTVADMGALIGENRIFVRYGLKQLKKTKRIGLLKLISICQIKPSEISPITIAAKIAPRLNSLGRIADPTKGVELLLLRNEAQAEALAKELDLNNIERQKIERKNAEEIERYIFDNPQVLDEKAIVLHSANLHQGIIPIITARIAKQYNRPTLIIATEEGIGKGSIRTIPEFPLLSVLRDNAEHLINFGGHDFAAGLSIAEENIEAIKKAFIQAANKKLKAKDIVEKLYLDAPIEFGEITFDFLESLSLLEPFGNENPTPILYCKSTQAWPPKIVGKTHLKLYLEQNDRLLEGIAFGMAHRRQSLCRKNLTIELAFTPYINTFLNKSSIQLQVRDFKIASK